MKPGLLRPAFQATTRFEGPSGGGPSRGSMMYLHYGVYHGGGISPGIFLATASRAAEAE